MPRVENPNAFPYDAVGCLWITLGGAGQGHGTGSQVDDIHIVTCAHNLYYKGQFATAASYYPHYDSTTQPAGGLPVRTGFIPRAYVEHPEYQGWDIAVYRLDKRSACSGYMEPTITTTQQDPPKELHIAGYPTTHKWEMWEDQEYWSGISVEHNLMTYLHETAAGNSGSPVYRVDSGHARLYSVHGGLISDPENKRGVLITQATFDFIKAAVTYRSPAPGFIVQLG